MKKLLTINITILTELLKTQKAEDPKGEFEHGWNASIDNAIHICYSLKD